MRKTSAFAKISVNSVCNLKCRMCDVGQKNLSSGLTSNFLGRTDIRPMEWMKIFKRLNIKHVYIQGTEPLLYDGIDELLELTHTAGILVTLTTNGWLLNKHASSLVKNNVNVWVSIDGLKLTHDKIRGVDGSYDKAMAGIEILKSKSLKNIYVSFAVTPDNTADIIPLYKILDGMKISMMANHYNFISSTSCADYNCTPVNISYYNPSDVNIEEIHRS
jgi:MoaA/NifB/PqqE/SkfB family radical SAM enzyme